MEPANDSETVETHGEASTDVQANPPPEMLAVENFPATLSHDGRYIQYNMFGNIFEVTAKYKPPIVPIGRGAFGFVCSAMNSETNEKVAIKKIESPFENRIEAKRALREIKILRHLEHENIVQIKDVILPPQRGAFEDVYIVCELMDCDLHTIIASGLVLQPIHYEALLFQLLCGLKCIHSANVLHRDLKPSNILVNMDCLLKICDFGLARGASENHAMSEDVATRWYRAPELLLNSSDYTSAVDIWAVGCVFMELITRKPMFPGRNHVHQLRLIMEFIGSPSEDELGSLNENAKRYLSQLPLRYRKSFFVKYPDLPYYVIDLMERMLKFDPRKRISVQDALNHKYFDLVRHIFDQPVCSRPFNFDLEQHPLTVEQIKDLIYREAQAFNPEPAIVANEH